MASQLDSAAITSQDNIDPIEAATKEVLDNIQGDIYPGLPKKTETFYFFRIKNGYTEQFRKALVNVVPLITSATKVKSDRHSIMQLHESNGHNSGEILPIVGANISFSYAGLQKMGFGDAKKLDELFIGGQKADSQDLGDAGKKTDKGFVPAWDTPFLTKIDGLILVAGHTPVAVTQKLNLILSKLKAYIDEAAHIRGDVRPGIYKGHEHFGYQDSISDPAVQGFDQTHYPGQEFIPANVIFTNGRGSKNLQYGSVLAFRYLQQLVPEFDQFVKDNSKGPYRGSEGEPNITEEEAAQRDEMNANRFGARLMGRWKSGAPVDLCPIHDDPALGKDPKRNNNFRYQGELPRKDQSRCPFSAHIRKTNPRADLEDPPNKTPTSPNRMIRRGIAYGPELGPYETKTTHNRGLLFVSYQSDLSKGYSFVQKVWSNTPGFVASLDRKIVIDPPGEDPIIGQAGSSARSFSGTDDGNPKKKLTAARFVIPKGGEYFFAPSISTLRDVLAKHGLYAAEGEVEVEAEAEGGGEAE